MCEGGFSMKINMKLVKKFKEVEDELKTFIFEREEVIKLVSVALLGKLNLFMIGDTGQAKSFNELHSVLRG